MTEGWGEKFLSTAVKATLIISVLQSIPIYTMNSFKVPIIMCNKVDSLIKKILYSSKNNTNRYITLKKWNEICKPKELGGLGFRSIEHLNTTLFN